MTEEPSMSLAVEPICPPTAWPKGSGERPLATNKADEYIAQKESEGEKSYLAEIIYAGPMTGRHTAASLPVENDVGGSVHRKSWSAS